MIYHLTAQNMVLPQDYTKNCKRHQLLAGRQVVRDGDGVKLGQALDGDPKVIKVEEEKGWVERPESSSRDVVENKNAYN